MAINFKKTNRYNILILILFSIFFSINLIKNVELSYFSPFDEHAHFDYWYKIYALNKIPVKFEKVGSLTTEIWACSGEPAFKHLKCGGDNDVKDMPWIGENTATPNMPTYYFMTAQVSKMFVLLSNLTESKDKTNYFELAKKSTVIWGVFSIFLLLSLALILKIRFILSLTLIAICSNIPFFIDLSTSINPEIFSLFASLLLLNLYFYYFKDRKRSSANLFLLALISGLCLTAKETSLAALLIISFYELCNKNSIKDNLIYVGKYLLFAIFIYAAIVLNVNLYRGSLVSNNLIAVLINSLPKINFLSNVSHVFFSYTESANQPAWRSIKYIYDFNFWGTNLILSMSKYQIYINFLILMFYFTFRLKMDNRNSLIFLMGWLLSVIMLPILMAITLKISGAPFFFQPRYYINYLILGFVGLFLALNDFFNSASNKNCFSFFNQNKLKKQS